MTSTTLLQEESLILVATSRNEDGIDFDRQVHTKSSESWAQKISFVDLHAPKEMESEDFITGDELLGSLSASEGAISEATRWVHSAFYSGQPDTLRSYRLSAGLSQVQLAQRMATKQSHVSRIENGSESNMTWDLAQRLRKALGIDMNSLEKALENQQRLKCSG